MSPGPSIGTLWYTRCPMPTASSIAIVDGWLDREFSPDGIDVLSLRANPDQQDRLAHYDHTSQTLFREGGVVPPLWARAGGASTRLLGVGLESGFRGLIVPSQSDIVEPSDLRHRRIALPRRIGQPVDFSRAVSWRGILDSLRVAGIDEREVDLVEVTSSDPYLTAAPPSTSGSLYTAWENVRLQSTEVLALVRGEVDAIFVAGGYGLEIAALTDSRVLVDLSERDPWPNWSENHLRVLTVSEALLAARPDLVVRYVATVQRAADWAARHRDDAMRIIAAEIGLAEEWARLGYHPETTAHLRLDTSDRALERLQSWAAFLSDRGFADPVDIGQWLDREPLAAANAAVAAGGPGSTIAAGDTVLEPSR